MHLDPLDLPDAARTFLSERHLASLTTMRANGTPHVVPVGFTFSNGIARVITNGSSVKVRNASRPGAQAALNQIDGRFWLTLEGPVVVSADPDEIALAVDRYAQRYRIPRVNPTRVVLKMTVQKIMGNI